MEEILLEKFGFYYGKNEILKDITLNMKHGEVCAILGPNGAGKSSLIKGIAGIAGEVSGKVTINGMERAEIKREELASLLAYVPQENGYFGEFTVFDTVMDGRYRELKKISRIENIQKVEAVLEEFDCIKIRDKKMEELSGGEKRRVLIARAAVQESHYILMDEPFSNLDIKHQAEVADIIRKFKKSGKTTVIMVIHDINCALSLSDYSVIIKDGEVFRSGITEEVITSETIKSVYGVTAEKIVLKEYPKGYFLFKI